MYFQLTNLEFDGVQTAIFEPDTLVMLLTAMTTRVNQILFLVLLLDTFGRIRLEIPVILQQHSSALDMQKFPLALGPLWQLAVIF